MSQPASRVVLIGASNISLGMRSLIRSCQQRIPGPIEFMIAAGHGRSLAMRTQVFIRRLPGILQCKIWEEIKTRPALPTYGLVTDIGNDLAYEVPENVLSGWIHELFQRLADSSVQTVVSLPPVESIERMQRWKFELLRRVLFPKSSLQFVDAVRFSREIAKEIEKKSNFFSFASESPESGWYGVDPIHIQRKFHDDAWSKYAQHWTFSDVHGAPGETCL